MALTASAKIKLDPPTIHHFAHSFGNVMLYAELNMALLPPNPAISGYVPAIEGWQATLQALRFS